jgi:hypothetical protein
MLPLVFLKTLAFYCRLQGSCNHIAGLLFRVEYAVRTGLVNLSSTSQRCKWNLPSTKISFTEPRVVSELEWTKVSYSKPGKKYSHATEKNCVRVAITDNIIINSAAIYTNA